MFVALDAMGREVCDKHAHAGLREHRHHAARLARVDIAAQVLDLFRDTVDILATLRRAVGGELFSVREADAEAGGIVLVDQVLARSAVFGVVGWTDHIVRHLISGSFDRAERFQFHLSLGVEGNLPIFTH